MIDKELTRFVRHFSIQENGCWMWHGGKTTGGYGVFRTGSLKDRTRRNVLSHRYAYEHKKGIIPLGLEIDHLCRNRLCVNPEHLEAVTRKENIKRSPLMNVTHCLYGHEKTRILRNGYKSCRICANLRTKKRRLEDPERTRALERDQYRRRQSKSPYP